MNAFKYLWLSMFLLLASCQNGIDYVVHGEKTEVETEVIILSTEPDPDIWIESFRQVGAYEKIDILWVIDGSCSMMKHKTSVLTGIEAMMNSLPLDVNWRLKMITTGDGRAVPQPQTFPLTRGDTIADALAMYNDLPIDGMEKGFDAVRNYVTLDTYAQTWLRSDAAMLVVFVSDEEEQSKMSAVDFQAWYQSLRSNVFLSFIGNVKPDESVCEYAPPTNYVGFKYMDAVNYFLGTIVDICETDWSPGVQDATQKIEPFKDWELKHIPYENTIVVFEDGVRLDPTEWSYDPVTNTIEFAEIPDEGVLVEIGYAIKYYNLNP